VFFIQISRSIKSKPYLFTRGPPTSALQNLALRSQSKTPPKSYEKLWRGFSRYISRPLKILILRAKILGMLGASLKFHKPRTLELIKRGLRGTVLSRIKVLPSHHYRIKI